MALLMIVLTNTMRKMMATAFAFSFRSAVLFVPGLFPLESSNGIQIDSFVFSNSLCCSPVVLV